MTGNDQPEIAPDRTIADALPAPVFVVQDHRFVYVNPAFAEVMGLPPAELIGRQSVERVHPDDRDVIQKRQAAAAAGRRTESSAQIRIRRGDGAELASSLRERFSPLAVVLMSGYPDDGAIAAAGLEREAVLRKPFSIAHLVSTIREALSRPRS